MFLLIKKLFSSYHIRMIENKSHVHCYILGEVASVFAGFAPYGRSPAGKGTHKVGIATIKNIHDGVVVPHDFEVITVEDSATLDTYRLFPQDVLVSARGSSFRAGVCTAEISNLIAGSNTIAIRLNEGAPISATLLVALLNSPKGEALLSSVAEGGTIRSLKPKTLQTLSFTLPDRGGLAQIEEYCHLNAIARHAALSTITSRQKIVNGLIESLDFFQNPQILF
jgi:hypothetical protein